MKQLKSLFFVSISTIALQSCGKVENSAADLFPTLEFPVEEVAPRAQIVSDVSAESIGDRCVPGRICRVGVTFKNAGNRTARAISINCAMNFSAGIFTGFESTVDESPIEVGASRSASCSFYTSGKAFPNNVEFGWVSISYTFDDLGSRETVRVPVLN
jgi:hypothetical protein